MAYEQLKDQIKDAPLSTIIGNFISLNKKGANLEAICPFHSDTKPSLKVNDAKGLYKCFACGAGGDAITFVKEYKKVDYVEALRDIAGILGLPFEEAQKEKKKSPKLDMAFRVLNASLKLYRRFAAQDPEPYKNFIVNRKLNAESIEKFQIAYAPANNFLLKYLYTIPDIERDFALNTALEIGIIRYNEDRDSHYDFYRDRVMFPIHDHSGQIRGYSSRAVLPDQNPKYLNSGESFAFNKGALMFGFYFARNAIRQTGQAIIVEGNMDVIMMHQFGYNQTVGTMGTALSEASVRLLGNMAKEVFLAMDSDAAGKKAMLRINADFMKMGQLPKYISFEPCKDPDEFLLAHGRLALLERMEKAIPFIDVVIQELIPEKIPENLEIRISTYQRIVEVISPLGEHLNATERVVKAARTLGLKTDDETIVNDYKKYLSHQKERAPFHSEKPKIQELEETIEIEDSKARNLQVQSTTEAAVPLSKSMKVFLKEIVCHPEFLTHLGGDEFLALIGQDDVKKLIQWLVKIYLEIDDAEYVTIVQEELEYGGYCKEVRDIGIDALFHYGTKYNEKVIQRMLKDYKLMLRMDQLKTKRKDLVKKQKTSLTQNEVDFILGEISKLDREIFDLNTTGP